MATLTMPRKRGLKLNKWMLIGAAAIVIALGAAYVIARPASTATSTRAVSTTTVSRGTITQTVSGNGAVTADQSVDLTFQASGIVQQVLVKEGDTVQAGQTLATLDARDLQAAVVSAQANLTGAQASLAQKENGNATAQEIASAQASVDSAQKAYDALLAGPTASELAAANAAVASGQAAYTAAQKDQSAGSSTLRSLKASLDQARIALQSAQAAYDRVAWRSDVGASSEAADLQDATISYEKALADYNAQLATSDADTASTVASARANLESAQKSLADLTPTSADIAAAYATLQSAKATLAGLTSAATDSDIAIAKANVTAAEQALKQAQLNLEQATLKAPFAGLISDIAVVPGGSASGTVLTLIDQDPLHVELTLSENDVVKTAVGQNVTLTSDAISDWKATGTVSYVAPTGTTSNGVVTYVVRVDFPNSDARVRVGMTLNVDITTAEKDNVLRVPNAAILPDGNTHIVQVLDADGKTQNMVIETGISDGTQTEIVSGVSEGQKIVALPSSTVASSSSNNARGGPGGFPGLP